MDIYHYVYRITNIVESKYYIGKRSSKIEPLKDLGVRYFSSSSNLDFIKDQKQNPQNYQYKIIFIFDNSKQAHKLEAKLYCKFEVDKNPHFYNIVKSSATNSLGFDPKNKISCKDQYGKSFYVDRNDERFKNKEIFGIRKGFVVVKDKNNNRKSISINNPKYINGEYTHINVGKKGSEKQKNIASKISSGTIPIVDINGNIFRINKNKLSDLDNNSYRHVATTDYLCEDDMGNRFWIEYYNPLILNYKLIYKGKGRKSTFIFSTPWGKFTSLKEAKYKAPDNITIQNIKCWCGKHTHIKINIKSYNLKFKDLYDKSIIGKTYNELGFYREKNEII